MNDCTIRISQDEMGRKAYMAHFNQAIRDGVPRVIVDRMNFNKDQRDRFIIPARGKGYCVTIFEFKTNRAICIERVIKRIGHPTVDAGNPELAAKIISFYQANYESPKLDEFDNYNEVRDEGEMRKIIT